MEKKKTVTVYTENNDKGGVDFYIKQYGKEKELYGSVVYVGRGDYEYKGSLKQNWGHLMDDILNEIDEQYNVRSRQGCSLY